MKNSYDKKTYPKYIDAYVKLFYNSCMNNQTPMVIEQTLDYAKNLTHCLTNMDAYLAHLDEQFKRIQFRTMHSEIMMDLAYGELHKLKVRIDNLENDLTAKKVNVIA